MHLEPFSNLRWAYQLHYYLCFQTRWVRPVFGSRRASEFISECLSEVCQTHDYHLLKSRVYDDHIRCIVSLRPEHVISRVINIAKSNVSRQFCAAMNIEPPLWATGYLARSTGRVSIQTAKEYLSKQSEHHGYSNRLNPPVYRFRETNSVQLTASHSSFELAHHIVLATQYRRGVFDAGTGRDLISYWIRVAGKRGFAIDQATVLPDHVHLIVRIVPSISVEQAVLSLMNNAQHWIGLNHPQFLIQAGIDRLWQDSAYAGACGTVTTAQLKAFLGREL